MEEKERVVRMVEGNITPDSNLMMGAILSVLRMREPSVGTSAMLAILSAHFINIECPKEEFLSICAETFDFYKKQIDEENAKREKTC